MYISNYEEVLQNIKQFLPEYLKEHGIIEDGEEHQPFLCIFPDHEDSQPSAYVLPGGVSAYCHGCQRNFDIIEAAHLLENKPRSGTAFLQDNLLYLAAKYNVSVTTGEITEKDKQVLFLYQIYDQAAKLLLSYPFSKKALAELKKRKWTEDQAHALGIGSIPSIKKWQEDLLEIGWTKQQLKEACLTGSKTFSPSCLTFVLKNHHGQTVSFSSRNLDFDSDKKGSHKYFDLPKAKNWNFKKNSYLHMANYVQAMLESNPSAPVYVVEGRPDVTTLMSYGLPAVATGGTSLTELQAKILQSIGAKNLILCFDPDKSGEGKTEDTIDKTLAGDRSFRTKILSLPDQLDPDEYFLEHTKEEFLSLPSVSPFRWQLDKEIEKGKYDLEDIDSCADLVEKMVPVIAGESDPIQQQRYIHQLAAIIGWDHIPISQKVREINSASEAERKKRKDDQVVRTAQKLLRYPEQAPELASQMIQALQEIESETNEDRFSADNCKTKILEQKEHEENKGEGFDGFLTPQFPQFQNTLYSDWSNALLLLGGRPNAGKTSWLSQLAMEIASNNDGYRVDMWGEKTKKTIVVYHSIDDPGSKIINRMLTQLARARFPQVTMNMLKNPNHWVNKRGIDERMLVARTSAYNDLIKLVDKGRLIIKDMKDGVTLDYVGQLLAKLREDYKDEKIVFFFDNLSKAKGTPYSDQRSIAKYASEKMKDFVGFYDVASVCTVEYKKTDERRPKDDDIAETIQFQYDADQIMHMWCDRKVFKQDSCWFWRRDKNFLETDPTNTDAFIEPVNELILTKSKLTDEEKTIFYDFIPSQAYYTELDTRYAIERHLSIKKHRGKGGSAYKDPETNDHFVYDRGGYPKKVTASTR